jgi:hypothetical protein
MRLIFCTARGGARVAQPSGKVDARFCAEIYIV